MDHDPLLWMHAVGISQKHAEALWAIVNDPNFSCLMTKPSHVLTLNYSGAKALTRPQTRQTAPKQPPGAPDRAS